MNKAYFEGLLKTPPKTREQKYIYLVSSESLAINIIAAGFHAVLIMDREKGPFYTADTFLNDLASLQYRGTQMTSYVYVPACDTKKVNDLLTEFFEANFL